MFGNTEPLEHEADFRAIHGGVAQFCPPGSRPLWYGDLASRLRSVDAWGGPPADVVPSGPAVALLSHDSIQVLPVAAPAQTNAPLSFIEAAAAFVDCELRNITLAVPTRQLFHNLCVHGTDCREVVAVLDRPGALQLEADRVVFLDGRQLGLAPVFAWLRGPVVSIAYLARRLGVFRLPTGYHLSLASAVPAIQENHIRVRHGDTITFGFRSDTDSDGDVVSGTGSDRHSQPPGSDSSTEDTDGPSPHSESHASHGSPCASPAGRAARSRTPPRGHRQAASVDGPGACLSATDQLLPYGPACVLSEAQSLVHGHSEATKLALVDAQRYDFFVGRLCKWQAGYTFHDALLMSAWLGTSAALFVSPFIAWVCGPLGLFLPYYLLLGCLARLLLRQARLDQEPPSHTAEARNSLLHIRRFAAERQLPWPTVPADDEFAMADPPVIATEAGSEEGSLFTFGLLPVDHVLEEVQVRLQPPATLREALEAVAECRDPVQGRVFPYLVPVEPQPQEHYGLLLALPGWAGMECIACHDLTAIDGRLYAGCVPTSASHDALLRLVDLPADADVDIYVGSDAAPVPPHGEVALWLGVCLFYVPRAELIGPYFWLPRILLSAATWDPVPALPYGPELPYLCAVGDNGHKGIRLPDGVPLDDNSILGGCFDLAIDTLIIQPAVPPVTGVLVTGFPCQAVYCVSGPEDLAAAERIEYLVLSVVDCRPILQGWHLLGTSQGLVDRASLVDFLSTFAPPGWRLYLERAEGTTPSFRVTPGLVLIASYVPDFGPGAALDELTPVEEQTDSEAPTSDATVTTSDLPAPIADSAPIRAPDLGRSRSRSPRGQTGPDFGHWGRACCSHISPLCARLYT